MNTGLKLLLVSFLTIYGLYIGFFVIGYGKLSKTIETEITKIKEIRKGRLK